MPSEWAQKRAELTVDNAECAAQVEVQDTELRESFVRNIAAELDKARDKTRPEYDLRCEDCDRAHILDTSLPSDIWNQITDPINMLCTVCIDRRLAEKGLTAEAEFYFVGKALVSKLYDNSILSRLRNPDEAMVEAVAKGMWTGIGEASPFSRLTMLGQARDAIRALADVLAATPPAKEE